MKRLLQLVALSGILLVPSVGWADHDRGRWDRSNGWERWDRGDDRGRAYGHRRNQEWRKEQKEIEKERRKAWKAEQKYRRKAARERDWRDADRLYDRGRW